MPWTYAIRSGLLRFPDGKPFATGYSGRGASRNRPEDCAMVGVGPIPPGRYAIGPAYKHPTLGPVCMNLDPLPGTDTHGRSLFRIHGDNAAHDASHGCIALWFGPRSRIADSTDRVLEVVEG